VDRSERECVAGLLVRLADGDRGAFDQLYDALLPKIRGFAERAAGAADAPDVAQAVMLKVFERASAYEPDRDAVAWIFGIAAFECRTLRTRARRRRETSLGPPHTEVIASSSASPEDVALTREIEAAFREAVGELSEADRETLRFVLSGDRPNIPAPTFRKRVERAFARFRHAFKGEAR